MCTYVHLFLFEFNDYKKALEKWLFIELQFLLTLLHIKLSLSLSLCLRSVCVPAETAANLFALAVASIKSSSSQQKAIYSVCGNCSSQGVKIKNETDETGKLAEDKIKQQNEEQQQQ